MDKTDIPESLGVFKPVGHTVIAFRSDGDMQAAVDALLVQGFASSACTRYSPEQMKAQVDEELRRASPLAAFGHELKLIEAHGALAQSGCSFLVVHAPDGSPGRSCGSRGHDVQRGRGAALRPVEHRRPHRTRRGAATGRRFARAMTSSARRRPTP